MPYAEGVTLITCTGDRPEAFKLCAGFVARQTYQGPLQWIIVADGAGVFPFEAQGDTQAFRYPRKKPEDFQLDVIMPKPVWQPGQNTLARNLLAAIPKVRYDKVLFIEDDDHYSADFVAVMAAELENGVTIAGNRDTPYYHLPSRRYRMMMNQQYASLCQTAIRAEELPVLAYVCKEGGDFIDQRLWQRAGNRSLRVGLPTGRVVGMKGLPGRPGIGIGHRPDSRPQEWTADPELKVLREWIGSDIELYREFL